MIILTINARIDAMPFRHNQVSDRGSHGVEAVGGGGAWHRDLEGRRERGREEGMEEGKEEEQVKNRCSATQQPTTNNQQPTTTTNHQPPTNHHQPTTQVLPQQFSMGLQHQDSGVDGSLLPPLLPPLLPSVP